MSFLKKYITFSIFLIFTIVTFNIIIIHQIYSLEVRKPTKTIFYKNSQEKSANALILGNSTTSHLDLSLFKKKIINASRDSNSATEYLNDYLNVQNNLSKDSDILVFLTPWTFTREYYKHSLYSLKRFLLLPHERMSKSLYKIFWPIDNHQFFLENIETIYFKQRVNAKVLYLEKPQHEEDRKFKPKKVDFTKFQTISSIDIDSLIEIQNIGRKKQHKITIVIPPAHSDTHFYLESIVKKIYINKKIKKLNTLNYMDLFSKENEERYFVDYNHLNIEGKKIFIEKLNEALQDNKS